MYLAYMDGENEASSTSGSDDIGNGDNTFRYTPGPSLKPAMWVVGLAAGIFIIGAVAMGLFGGSGYTPPPPSNERPAVNGITAIPAKRYLTAIEADGQPPLNVIYSLTIPQGTVTDGTVVTPGLAISYDKAIAFISNASQQQVINFYSQQLPAHHWSIISKGATGKSHSYEFIARINGEDGQFWELGITISPTTFTDTVPSHTAAMHATSPISSKRLPKGIHSDKDYTKYTFHMFPISSEAAS